MKLHRPSAFGTCPSAVGMAVGAVLMAYLAFKGEAFLRPAAVKHSEAMRQVVRGAELERAQPLEGRWRLRFATEYSPYMKRRLLQGGYLALCAVSYCFSHVHTSRAFLIEATAIGILHTSRFGAIPERSLRGYLVCYS